MELGWNRKHLRHEVVPDVITWTLNEGRSGEIEDE